MAEVVRLVLEMVHAAGDHNQIAGTVEEDASVGTLQNATDSCQDVDPVDVH